MNNYFLIDFFYFGQKIILAPKISNSLLLFFFDFLEESLPHLLIEFCKIKMKLLLKYKLTFEFQ